MKRVAYILAYGALVAYLAAYYTWGRPNTADAAPVAAPTAGNDERDAAGNEVPGLTPQRESDAPEVGAIAAESSSVNAIQNLIGYIVGTPGQYIEELSLLDMGDWWIVLTEHPEVRDGQFEEAARDARDAGRRKVMTALATAVRSYRKEHTEWPATPAGLGADLQALLPDSVLQHYQLLVSGPIKEKSSDLNLVGEIRRENLTGDLTRFLVRESGYTYNEPWSRLAYSEGIQEAKLAYAADHDGVGSPIFADYSPYIQPPEMQEMLVAGFHFAQDNQKMASSVADVAPYISDLRALELARDYYGETGD